MKKYLTANFVPKSSRLQPDYYQTIGNQREAVFIANNRTYIITIYSFSDYEWDHVELLEQKPTHRTEICTTKTIKAAIKKLCIILNK